jgi:serpin B
LINALYFNANWSVPFDPDYTSTDIFKKEDGSQVECQMMQRKGILRILARSEFRAVEVPYGDSLYNICAMIPAHDSQVADLLPILTIENWQIWQEDFHDIDDQKLWFPKFEFEYAIGLNDILKSMGMGIAFSFMANFDSLLSSGPTCIDTVFHKTYVKLDEKGTEAAAVTVVGGELTGGPTGVAFNRPFIFIIQEKTTGAIVFMGRIAEPIWEG